MKIFIDPGHGGKSVGASYNSRKEQDDAYSLAKAVEELLLTQQGVEVMLSRKENENPSISERCRAANKWGADYFLSLHRNAAVTAETGSGNEIWVHSAANEQTQYKASVILEKLCEAYPLKNRGVKHGAPSYKDFGVNTGTKMASALLEAGFINNSKDNIAFDENFYSIALSLARGLMEVCGGVFVLSGDCDKDGKITSADARLALRMAVGLEEADAVADVNGDGKITSADAREILITATGKGTSV